MAMRSPGFTRIWSLTANSPTGVRKLARAPRADAAVIGGSIGQRMPNVLLAIQAAFQVGGFGRRELHQRADGLARPVHGVALERLAQAKQEHDERSLRPLTDRSRTCRCDGHQEVDVELPGQPQVCDAFAGDVVAAHEDGKGVEER